jgi:hypothetical protein
MSLSNSCEHWDGSWFLIFGVVAEHDAEDVDAAAGEGDEGLLMEFSFGSFLVVERS